MNLSFMDTETTSQIFSRVDRERERIESLAERTPEQAERHAYLCQVCDALEIVGGFLNGEHADFCESRRNVRNPDREIFNTP